MGLSRRTPDSDRLFTELYNVQLLNSAHIDDVCRITICTIQRLHSILRDEELSEVIERTIRRLSRASIDVVAGRQEAPISASAANSVGNQSLVTSSTRFDGAAETYFKTTVDVCFK